MKVERWKKQRVTEGGRGGGGKMALNGRRSSIKEVGYFYGLSGCRAWIEAKTT